MDNESNLKSNLKVSDERQEIESSPKKDMCISPYMNSKIDNLYSEEEIKTKIDELNDIYEEYSNNSVSLSASVSVNNDNEEVENLNQLLLDSNSNKVMGKKLIMSAGNNKDNLNSESGESNDTTKGNTSSKEPLSQFELINQDPYLKPFENKIKERVDKYKYILAEIEKNEDGILNFSRSYKNMGLIVNSEGILYREYAPGAKSLTIVSL